MDDVLQDFLAEAAERLATVDQDILLLEKDNGDPDALARIFRAVHNIKSSAGFLHLSRLQALSHVMETVLVAARDGNIVMTPMLTTLLLAGFDRLRRILADLERQGVEAFGDDGDLLQSFEQAARRDVFVLPVTENASHEAQANTMRVDITVLENLMALTGELVLMRNRLQQAGNLFDVAGRPVSLQKLEFLVSDIQAEVLKSRMQPVMQAFRALPRLLRDAAVASGKRVRLTMSGTDTGLDRQVLEAIRDPLAHLLRNAVVHGIEMPDARQNTGKSAEGTVHLAACYADGCVVIKITDDGGGLDTARIAAQAAAQGLVGSETLAGMKPADIWPFIFVGGFSTHGTADHLAGRGVGLDVVRTAVEKIGGSVHVESQAGRGTVFTLRLPLTLAISPCIIVRVGALRYALPQTAVSEMVLLKNNIEYVGDKYVLRLRRQVVPLLTLGDILQMPSSIKVDKAKAVLLRGHKGIMALAVDDIEYAEDVVVKPLPEIFGKSGYFLGSAVLACGGLALIIDPNRLMEKYIPLGAAALPPLESRDAPVHKKLSCVIFRPADDTVWQALALSDVWRLMDHAVDRHARSGKQGHLFQSEGGHLMPLYRYGQNLRQAIIVQTGGCTYALAAEKIMDIAAIAMTDLQSGDSANGIRHRFLWQGNMVELLDAGFYAQTVIGSVDPHKSDLKKRVLLIDDSPFFCRLMRPMLQSAGYDVVSVGSAAEAMALCRQGQRFEAVISDIEMPDTNGLQLAMQIRRLPMGKDVPLLAMSSYATSRDEARAREAGFDHFFNKFDSAGLVAALAKVRGAA